MGREDKSTWKANYFLKLIVSVSEIYRRGFKLAMADLNNV
jgi:hypothetical protein